MKLVALKTTTNIQAMIKDLMHVPPSYKATVRLSWKPATATAADPTVTKRPAAAANNASTKTTKMSVPHMDRAMYAPPTGKYSVKAGSAPGT